MRLSKAQREENHDRILHTAAKLFREKGVDGVGIDEIMAAAKLTHGAFYGHFPSKAALIEAAGAYALEESRPALFERPAPEDGPRQSLAEIVEFYLAPPHRDNPGCGCAAASLAADMGRQSIEARRSFADGLEVSLERLARLLTSDPENARREAIAIFATMVGALVMARGTAGTPLSPEILEVVTQEIKAERPMRYRHPAQS